MIKLTTINIYYIFRPIWTSDFYKFILNKRGEMYISIFDIYSKISFIRYSRNFSRNSNEHDS